LADSIDHADIAETTAYVRRLIETTLTRLGPPAAELRVHEIEPAEQLPPPRPGLEAGQHLRITVGPGTGPVGPATIWAYYTLTVPAEEATVATVEQIQDHVIELAHGPAVPPCPGHAHPLQPVVLDGTPSWVCPVDPQHHHEPILTR
jgi:hypothetical protein